MSKFALYAKPTEDRPRARWTPFRAAVWILLFITLGLWAYSFVIA